MRHTFNLVNSVEGKKQSSILYQSDLEIGSNDRQKTNKTLMNTACTGPPVPTLYNSHIKF